MDAATLAGFDPVWPVLAAAAAMLIAIVIGIVRHDRLASRQPGAGGQPGGPDRIRPGAFGGGPGRDIDGDRARAAAPVTAATLRRQAPVRAGAPVHAACGSVPVRIE